MQRLQRRLRLPDVDQLLLRARRTRRIPRCVSHSPTHTHFHPFIPTSTPARVHASTTRVGSFKTSRLASPIVPSSHHRAFPHTSRVASRRVACSRRVAHRSFDGILRTRKVPSTVSRHHPRPSERRRSLVVVVARARQRRRRGRPRGASRRRTGAFAGRGRVSLLGLTVVQYECRVRVVPFLFSGRVLSVVFRTRGSYSYECMRDASVCVNERMGSIVDRVRRRRGGWRRAPTRVFRRRTSSRRGGMVDEERVDKTEVYLRYLPRSATEAAIREMLAGCGKIIESGSGSTARRTRARDTPLSTLARIARRASA